MKELSKNTECSMQIVCVEHLKQGKRKIYLDNGCSFLLYLSEMRALGICEGELISHTLYCRIMQEIIGKRAKKRALHLLEKMDRSEAQLREKLAAGEYPPECIEDAISYVKKFHYLDDYRYACNFVRYRQESLSCQQIKQKLMTKGVKRDIIDLALEKEYAGDEQEQICKLLAKKHYTGAPRDSAEFRKTYQFLLRRGFHNHDILKEMGRFQENNTTYGGDLL